MNLNIKHTLIEMDYVISSNNFIEPIKHVDLN